jgi:hypothetical protein
MVAMPSLRGKSFHTLRSKLGGGIPLLLDVVSRASVVDIAIVMGGAEGTSRVYMHFPDHPRRATLPPLQ